MFKNIENKLNKNKVQNNYAAVFDHGRYQNSED